MTWDAPEQLHGSQILNYTVESDGDCCNRSPAANALSTEIAGLEIGKEYKFRVRAYSTNGAGEWSEWSRGVKTGLPSLRYVSWNIKRNLEEIPGNFLPDAANRGPIEDIADAIGSEQPDVVALQEVTSDQADAIATRLGWPGPFYWPSETPCPVSSPVPPGCVPFGNALLSHHTLTNTDHWLLPPSPLEKPDQRVLLRAAIIVTGVRFHLYTTHLTSGAEGDLVRSSQATAIVAQVDQDRASASAAPFLAVVMGDLNADETDPAIHDVMAVHFQDVSDRSPTSNPRGVLNRRIDYIFVDNEGPWKINEARVIQTGELSDHLALFARL